MDEGEASAELAAAAPEMYEALKEALAEVSGYMCDYPDEEVIKSCKATLKRGEAALRKARGEE